MRRSVLLARLSAVAVADPVAHLRVAKHLIRDQRAGVVERPDVATFERFQCEKVEGNSAASATAATLCKCA
jgi:hypothetical protein